MVRLVISDHEGSTTVVPLLRDEVTIGRKEGNTIRLTERNISRRHVQLLRVGGVYNLRDLDSYNGVLVNGRKVEGESTLNNGDQIQLGDYTILVEEDVSARAATAPVQDQPAPVSRRPIVPARLVMLTQPASGAEFVLPLDRSARLGRSDDVDCPINHRSVSREHASIRRDGDVFVIEDMGSSNGVTVNKRPVKSAELRSGDIIELGQVVFRFVAAGEHYFFDPAEAARYRSARVGKNTATLRLAALLGAVTLAALVFVLLPTPEIPPPPDAEPSSTHFPGEGDLPPAATTDTAVVPPPVTAPSDDGYDTAVLACRSALAALRFSEAAAQASMALKIRPASSEALDCKQRAEAQAAEEQMFVRGKDALARGEYELAYVEFSRLPEHSSFRERSEIALATSELARARLADARAALPGNRAESARLAQSVLGLRGISQEQASAAEQVLAEARGGKPAAQAPVAAAPRQRPAAAAAAPSRPSSLLAPNQATDTQRSSRINTNTSAAAASGARPLDIANACLARGDNECIVQALEGSAGNPQELALLIETYRTMGNVRQAQKHMSSYVQRFPNEKRSESYRRLLELQKQ